MDEQPLSEQELHTIREVLRDYDRARWLRGQAKWWGIWLLGVPTALVAIFQAFDAIIARFIHK